MTQRRKRAKGTLTVIGTLLVLSALLRFGANGGQVIASETLEKFEALGTQTERHPDLARPQKLEALLEALNRRDADISARESEMEMREKSVEIAEDAIEMELARLQQAEEQLRATIHLASQAAEDDIARLTKVYADMKPKQAAALFEQMDSSFAAGFLARMPSENAARIMAGITPEKAYQVSVELASRNAEIPLE